jgi:hypothetical protein
MEGRGPCVLWVGIYAIEYQRVDMQVQIDGPAEALQRAHGTTLAVRHAKVLFCPPAQRAEDGSEEDAEDLATQLTIVRDAIPKRDWKAQDPLADGDFGKNAIDEVCGCIRHAAASTGGAESSPFT